MASGRTHVIAVLLAVFLTAGGVTVAILSASPGGEEAELPVLEPAPDFTLVNQDDATISLHEFRGRPVVLSFFYVRCTDANVCPCTTKNVRRIQELCESIAGSGPVFLQVTFDPANDSPGKLRKYGELYGADFSNWHFLTGEKKVVDKVCRDYGIIHEDQEGGTIRHSAITFLIGPDMNIRRMYVANRWEPEQIHGDIMKLLERKE